MLFRTINTFAILNQGWCRLLLLTGTSTPCASEGSWQMLGQRSNASDLRSAEKNVSTIYLRQVRVFPRLNIPLHSSSRLLDVNLNPTITFYILWSAFPGVRWSVPALYSVQIEFISYTPWYVYPPAPDSYNFENASAYLWNPKTTLTYVPPIFESTCGWFSWADKYSL